MKNYFNRLGFVLFPFLVSYIIAYILGAFVSLSWSPAEWTESWRIMTIIIGSVYGLGLWFRLEMDAMKYQETELKP